MKEVTISLKTTFRLMKELSGLPSTDERIGLVNLLSREALGDIKAEEKCLPGMTEEQQLDAQTRQRIANALGMPWGTNVRTDDIVKFINDHLTKGAMENIRLLEALCRQLNVTHADQLSGALANLKQNHVEAERDLEKEVEVSKYLRSCLQEIGRALNQTNLTPASVTETALVYIKEKESTEHPDTFKVNSIKHLLSCHGYREHEVLLRIKDIVNAPEVTAAQRAADSASDPVLHLTAKVSELEAKLALVNRQMSDIKDAVERQHIHMETHALASRVREILARHPSPLRGVRP